jgi:phage gp36-like protein
MTTSTLHHPARPGRPLRAGVPAARHRSTGTGEVDQGKVNRAIGDATELVNSYLGKRYTLPVPFVPGALERVAADLVRYFLYSSQPGEEVTKRYDDGVKWLKDVANGVVSLGLPVPGNPGQLYRQGGHVRPAPQVHPPQHEGLLMRPDHLAMGKHIVAQLKAKISNVRQIVQRGELSDVTSGEQVSPSLYVIYVRDVIPG